MSSAPLTEESSNRSPPGRVLTIAVIAALLWGLYWRTCLFPERFVHGHLGSGGSHIATFVRNLYRYGPLTTKLGSVEDQGKTAPEDFHYAHNHPPLKNLFYAPGWAVAPGREWTFRATALVFALVAWITLFVLARESLGQRAALALVGLGAILPMGSYYDGQVDTQGPDILALSVLMLFVYVRWLARPRVSLWAILLTLLLLGSASEWPIYYMAAAIALDLLLFREGRHPVRAAVSLACLAVAAFTLYVAYVATLQGSSNLLDGLARLLHGASGRSTLSLPEAIQRAGPNGPRLFLQYLNLTTKSVLALFSITALALTLLAAGELVVKAAHRRLALADRIFLMLFVFGSLHVVLFAGGAVVHDYWWKYLLPAVAWGSARSLLYTVPRLIDLLARNKSERCRTTLRTAFTIALLASIIIPSARHTVAIFQVADWSPYERGTVVAQETGFDDVILGPDPRADPVLLFYMDRLFVPRVRKPKELADALATHGSRAALFIVHRGELENPGLAPLLSWLDKSYPYFERSGHRFYRLR
ncbi:MAG: glycosyltransferase family 39 protein [Planctomycetota bacterium]